MTRESGCHCDLRKLRVFVDDEMFIWCHRVEAGLRVKQSSSKKRKRVGNTLSDDALLCRIYGTIHCVRGAVIVAAMQTHLHAFGGRTRQGETIKQRLPLLHLPNIDGHPILTKEVDTADRLEPMGHLPGDAEWQVQFAQYLWRPRARSDD